MAASVVLQGVANTITSALLAASFNVVTSAYSFKTLCFSSCGLRVSKHISCPLLLQFLPNVVPTLPAPMIAIFIFLNLIY
jgi:hypothetical protein